MMGDLASLRHGAEKKPILAEHGAALPLSWARIFTVKALTKCFRNGQQWRELTIFPVRLELLRPALPAIC
jgi:hypothetical protein